MSGIRVVFGDGEWRGGGDWGGPGDPVDVAAIAAHDPGFNVDAFLSFAQGVFLGVTRARAAGQVDGVRRLLVDGMWTQLQGEGPVPELAGVAVDHARLVAAGAQGGWDTAVVRFTARPTAGHHHEPWTEDWTFQRPVHAPPAPAAPAADDPGSAEAGPSPVQAGTQECPNCGAPLVLDDDGSCRYCHVSVAGGLGGWRLARTERPEPPSLPFAGSAAAAAAKAGRRTGVIVAVIVFASVLPAVIGIILAATAGHKAASDAFKQIPSPHGTAGGTTQLSGQATFSGGVTGTTDGDVSTTGGAAGTCAGRAANVIGLTFQHAEQTVDNGVPGTQALAFALSLPPGAKGPGTYAFPGTAMTMDATFVFTPDEGKEGGQSQVWHVGPTATVTLQLLADDSGTLNVNGLVPADHADPNDSLSKSLNIAFHLSCA
jgi:hypothetical protein